MEMNEYVEVKCNKCGKEWGFFPMQVMYGLNCDCGNNDDGNCRDWEQYKFGNFTFIKSYLWDLHINLTGYLNSLHFL